MNTQSEIAVYPISAVPESVLETIAQFPWTVAQALCGMIRSGERFAKEDLLLCKMKENRPVGFATLQTEGCIPGDARAPWVGFAYVSAENRGEGILGELLQQAQNSAVLRGFQRIYVAAAQRSVYEKYGFCFEETCTSGFGESVAVCSKALDFCTK